LATPQAIGSIGQQEMGRRVMRKETVVTYLCIFLEKLRKTFQFGASSVEVKL
jgi:hypothetical protein